MILLDYIQISKFAKKNKISRTWAYQLIKDNKLNPPAVKIGNTFFVNKNTEIKK